ncbi:DtxR family iron (metal) dependent repressor [Kineothrix alysoides]|uniref:Manganese transport regulator n=1 Tax=Kineothrix alysoides TaxID=1469948 RepID=A0A4R1QPH0_9FIRM|nr:transcriptional regulator MntR [Kineothrix alysoides]TCL55237.1 DtxR family iron (metal) dependent repressor [Kineothrix alysoides]
MKSSDFHTFNEYMKKDDSSLTASMEDYIEMISRLSAKNGFTRINELSQALNIQPSSATKMVQRLSEMGYIKYEKYSVLFLEEKGKEIGDWLIKRHMIIENFMRIIGVDSSMILEETEKIEHTLSNETTACIESLIDFFDNSPDIISRFKAYRTERYERVEASSFQNHSKIVE